MDTSHLLPFAASGMKAGYGKARDTAQVDGGLPPAADAGALWPPHHCFLTINLPHRSPQWGVTQPRVTWNTPPTGLDVSIFSFNYALHINRSIFNQVLNVLVCVWTWVPDEYLSRRRQVGEECFIVGGHKHSGSGVSEVTAVTAMNQPEEHRHITWRETLITLQYAIRHHE